MLQLPTIIDVYNADDDARDVLSPRRSPQQADRVKRSHRFPTDYRGVSVRIYEGSNFMHPRDTVTTKPAVHLLLGMDAYPCRVGVQRAGTTIWDFDSQCDLPYRGQPRLRFLLVDLAGPRPVQVGFKDLNITDEVFRDQTWEGRLTLLGRRGPCGILRVSLNLTKELVDVPKVIELPVLSLSPVSGPESAGFAHSISSDDEQAFAIRSSIDSSHRSVRVHVHQVGGVPAGSHPYVTGVIGSEKVRSTTHFDRGDRVPIDEIMVFPYAGTRYLKLSAKDDKKIQVDPKLGSVTVDLQGYLQGGEAQRVLLPVAKKGEQHGDVLVTIAFSDEQERKGRLISGNAPTEEVSADSSSISSSDIPAENLRDGNALRIRILNLTDLNVKEPINIYIKGKLGHKRLRSSTVPGVASSTCAVDQGFVWPVDGQRYVKFTAKSDVKDHKDNLLGTGSFDLLPTVEDPAVGPKKTKCSLKDRHGVTFGTLHLAVELIPNFPIDEPYIEEYDNLDTYDPVGDSPGSLNSVTADITELGLSELAFFDRNNLGTKLGPDPYIVCQFGSEKLKGPVYKNAGFKCKMSDRFIFPAEGEPSRGHILKYDVFDRNVLKDSCLGTGHIDLPKGLVIARPYRIQLINSRGQRTGYLNLLVTTSMEVVDRALWTSTRAYTPRKLQDVHDDKGEGEDYLLLPADVRTEHGSFSVDVMKLAGLKNPKPKIDRLDPYVILSFHTEKLQGSVKRDGGVNVSIGDVFHFPYKPCKYLKIEVFDQAHLAKDPLLGSALVTLDKYVHKDLQKLKIPLVAGDDRTSAGTAFVVLKFEPQTIPKAYVDLGDAVSPRVASNTVADTVSSSEDEKVSFNNRAFHVTGLKLCLDMKETEHLSPFIQTKYGHKKLKGVPMRRPTKVIDWKKGVAYSDRYSYTTKDKSVCAFAIRDDIRMHRDRCLARATVNMHELESQAGGVYPVPFRTMVVDRKGRTVGDLTGLVIFDDMQVPHEAAFTYCMEEEEDSSADSRSVISNVKTSAKSFSVSLRYVENLQVGDSGTLHPYIIGKFGRAKLRSCTADQKIPGQVQLGDVMYFPYKDFQTLRLQVKDNKKMHIDPTVGTASLNVADFIDKSGTTEAVLPVKNAQDTDVGQLHLQFTPSERILAKAYVVSTPAGGHVGARKVVDEVDQALARSRSSSSSVSDMSKNAASAVQTKSRSFKLELLEAEGFGVGTGVVINPYVIGEFAHTKLRSATAWDSDSNCKLGDVMYIPYAPYRNMLLRMKAEKKMKVDPTLCQAWLNLDNLINGTPNQVLQIAMKTPEGQPGGQITVRFTPMEEELSKGYIETAQHQRYQVESDTEIEARGLTSVTTSNRSFHVEILNCEGVPIKNGEVVAPYVIGRYKHDKLRTSTVNDQGSNFRLGDIMFFPWQNHGVFNLTLYDNRKMRLDPLIGVGFVQIDRFINGDGEEVHVPLQDKNGIPAGRINIRVVPMTNYIEKAYIVSPEIAAKQKAQAAGGLRAATAVREKAVLSRSSSSLTSSDRDVAFHHRAFHLGDLKLNHVTPAAIEGEKFTPYLLTRYGRKKLRGEPLEDFMQLGDFQERHSYATKRHARVRVKVVNDRRMEADKIVGTLMLDIFKLERAFQASSTFVQPIMDKEGSKVGELTGCVSFDDEIIPQGHRLTSHGVVVHLDSDSSGSRDDALQVSQVKTNRTGFSVEILSCAHLLGDVSISPFVVGRFGQAKLRSATVKEGGSNPAFGDIMYFPYKPLRFVDIKVRDDKKHRLDSTLGLGRVDIDRYINGDTTDVAVPLTNKRKEEAGQLLLRFFPLTSTVDRAYIVSPKASELAQAKVGDAIPVAAAVAQQPKVADRSLHVERPSIVDVDVSKLEGNEFRPYLISKYEGNKLRGATVSTAPYTFPEVHAYRLKDKTSLMIAVYNNRKLATDKLVGIATIPIPVGFGKHPFSVAVLEKGSTRQVASMIGILMLDEAAIPNGHCLTGSNLASTQPELAAAFASGSSSSSDEEQPASVTTNNKAFSVEILKCEGLRLDPKHDNNLNSYVLGHFGRSKLRTQTAYQSGRDPEFGDIMFYPYNPFKLLTLSVKDNLPMHVDTRLGRGVVDVDSVINARSPVDLEVPLRDKKGNECGHAIIKFTPLSDPVDRAYIIAAAKERPVTASADSDSDSSSDGERVPAGVHTDARSFTLEVVDGRGLAVGRNSVLQPFVEVKVGRHKLKTHTVKDGGANPVFGDQMSFPYESLRTIKVYAKDNCRMRRNTVVGNGSFKLDDYIGHAATEFRVPLANLGVTGGFINFRMTTSPNEVARPYVLSPELPHQARRAGARAETLARSLSVSSKSSTEAEVMAETFMPREPIHKIEIHVMHGQELKFDTEAALSPYIVAKTGHSKLRSATVRHNGSECLFGDVMHFPFKGYRYMKLRCYDNRRLARDPVLGEGLLDIQATPVNTPVKVPLRCVKTNQPRGEITVKVLSSQEALDKAYVASPQFEVPSSGVNSEDEQENRSLVLQKIENSVPHKGLKIEVFQATGLQRNPQAAESRLYVLLQLGRKKLQGHTDLADKAPAVFKDQYFFPYDSQRYLKCSLCENLPMRRDTTLGSGFVDLQPLIQQGGDVTVSVTPSTSVMLRVTPVAEAIAKAYVTSPETTAMEASSSSDNEVDILNVRSSVGTDNRAFQVEFVSASRLPMTSTRHVLQPYVVGRNHRSKVKSTTIKDGGWDLALGNQVMVFPWQGYRYLQLRVYDNQRLKRDPTIAEGVVDLDPMMGSRTTRDVVVPMHHPNGAGSSEMVIRISPTSEGVASAYLVKSGSAPKAGSDASSNLSDELHLRSHVTHPHNSFRMFIIRGKDLVGSPKGEVLQPFVLAKFGGDKLRSHTVRNGGPNAFFNSEMVFPYQHYKFLHLKVKDNVKMARDPVIGLGRIDLDNYIVNSNPIEIDVPLLDTQSGRPAGMLTVRITPAIDSVKKAYAVDLSEGLPPSVTVNCKAIAVELVSAPGGSITGGFGNNTLRTSLPPLNGTAPFKLEETFVWPYQPYKHISLQVYEHTPLERDPLIGSGNINVDNFLANATKTVHSIKLPLLDKKGQSAGAMTLRLRFLDSSIPEAHVVKTSTLLNRKMVNRASPKETVDAGKLSYQTKWKSLTVHISQLKDLHDVEIVGKLDPYVKLRLGDLEMQSDVYRNAGTNVDTDLVFRLPYHQENKIIFQVLDEEHWRKDQMSGMGVFDLEPHARDHGESSKTVALDVNMITPHNKPAGKAVGTVKFSTEAVEIPTSTKVRTGGKVI